MYLEKAKAEEFEFYYGMKCEPFINFWSQGDDKPPPRENLFRFYMGCVQDVSHVESDAGEVKKHRDIYLVKTDAGEAAGYLYLDISGDCADLPVAIRERFTKRGLARQAVFEGLRLAKAQGCARSQVEIREDNAASIRLYTACGYRKGKKTREIYAPALQQTVALYAYGREI